MTYANTTLLGLNQPTTGSESGVWGDDVNNGFTQLVDLSVAGTNNITQDSDITIAVSNGNNASSFTSTATNSTVAQYMKLLCTGARTATRYINAPNSSKMYIVTNLTTGGYPIVLRGVTGPTTGITIAPGEKVIAYWNTVTSDFTRVTYLDGLTAVTAAGTTTSLTSGSPRNYIVSGSGGQTFQFPAATSLAYGTQYSFNNNQSSGTVVVKNASGTTLVTVQSGAFSNVILTDNTTSAGTWDYHNAIPNNASWSTNTLSWAGSYTNGTWNGNVITGTYGGTGVNNGTSTITIGGNLTFSGAYTTAITVTGNTTATFPTSGYHIATVTNMANNPVTGTPSSSNFLRGDGTWAAPTTTTPTAIVNGTSNVTVNTSGGTVTVATNGTTALTVDTSQNLGLGVTPNTWNGGLKAFQNNGAAFIGDGNNFYIANNAYYNSGWKYINSNYSTNIQSNGAGQITFNIAPSGTAGNAISFTQAMTLDNSGRLGIGTTSPSAPIDVNKSGGGDVGYFRASGGTNNPFVYINSNESSNLVSIGSNASVTYPALAFQTSGSERMRIDTSGNLVLGTTSSLSASSGRTDLTVNGSSTAIVSLGVGGTRQGYLYTPGGGMILAADGAQPVIFTTNGSERARVSSTGGFSVGTSSDPGAGAIYATGNITAYYSSDIKFKTNVQDIQDPLGIVTAIGSKTFDWTDEYLADHGGEDEYFQPKQSFGVIAQDVQKVFPQAVRTRTDGSLAVDYEKLAILSFGAFKQIVQRLEALESK